MTIITATASDRPAYAAELLDIAAAQGVPRSQIELFIDGFIVPPAVAAAFNGATALANYAAKLQSPMVALAEQQQTLEQQIAGKADAPGLAAIAAPTAAGGLYSQSQANSVVAAVNDIRAALTAAGITL